MADAGKVMIFPRGNYDATSVYEVLDLVNHNGASWVAKKNAINGIVPSEANSEFWFKMAGHIVANNLTTSAEGYVLDARQGKLLQDALAVERARINQFTKLAEGSTTGDAELMDARVGADGVTYENLGEANRTQFANLKSDLSNYKNDLCSVFPSANGYVEYDTATKIFKIPSSTTLYHNDKYYLVTAELEIDITNDVDPVNTNVHACKIIFNTDTNSLEATTYKDRSFTGFPVALINDNVNDVSEGPKSNVYVNGCFIVDGCAFGIDLNKVFMSALNPCVCSRPSDFLEVDLDSETIRIPYCFPIDKGTFYYCNDQTISFSDLSTNGCHIYFNKETDNAEVKPTTYVPTKNDLLLAIVTWDADKTMIRGVVSNIPYRYTYNNILYTNTTMLAETTGSSEYYGMTQKAITEALATKGANISYNIKSVSHRGYNAVAPENTLSAFKLSKKKGFGWIETDVQFTSDGIPVMIHDDTINRTARNADGTEISTEINVSDSTYSDLLNYDFGVWKSEEYAETAIPTFEETVLLCRNIGLKIRIELKSNSCTQANVQTLYDIVKKYGMLKNVEWASSDTTALGYVHSIDADADICVIVKYITQTVIDTAISLRGSNVVTIAASISVLDESQITLASENKMPVDAWTITNESQITNCHPYVSSFTTDEPNAGEVLYNANIN